MNFKDIHWWNKYDPVDYHYVIYHTYITYSDEEHLGFIRKTFIENTLIYYNICIDLLWQVLWLYSEADNL